MGRILAIGDIHGGLKALKQLLERAEVRNDDTLIFIGDYVDGWSESAQVVQFIIELSKKQSCICIKGNHDLWCEDWLRSGTILDVWYAHGGKETIESYQHFSEEEKQRHLHFFEDMLPFYIDHDNRLFVHAGFTSMHGVEREVNKNSFYFDRTLWEMALAMKDELDKNSMRYPKRLQHYMEIFIGHTPTINFNSYQPMQAANIWNIDTGAAFYGMLSAIDVNSKEIFQSEKVQSFYPDEKGRNK